MNKKGALELTLAITATMILTVLILVFFFKVGNLYANIGLKGQKTCEKYLDDYNRVIEDIKNLEPGKKLEELIDIKSNCALIAFSKSKESFVSRPDQCLQQSCLCICYVGADGADADDCLHTKYCTNFEDIEEIKGNQKINNFEEQIYVNDFRAIEISRIDNTIKLLVLNKE